MKKIVLLSLVFVTTFLNAQSVDPETFPALNSGIGIKYLYTNTGGEGKILVDSIATRMRSYWTNGVNGQDSLGLGGQLVQNTNINLNEFNLSLDNGFSSGSGNTISSTINGLDYDTYLGAFKFPLLAGLNASQSFDGSGQVRSAIAVNSFSGLTKYTTFSTRGDTITDNLTSEWEYKNDNIGDRISIRLNELDGFKLSKVGWLNKNLLNIDNVFIVKNQGGNTIITQKLPQYQDDADAGANGLTTGDLYQTNGAGSAPLNVAGIVMIKQ